jgi:hypothetical protein
MGVMIGCTRLTHLLVGTGGYDDYDQAVGLHVTFHIRKTEVCNVGSYLCTNLLHDKVLAVSPQLLLKFFVSRQSGYAVQKRGVISQKKPQTKKCETGHKLFCQSIGGRTKLLREKIPTPFDSKKNTLT